MNDFAINKERSLRHGWLTVIKHPDWNMKEPDYAVVTDTSEQGIRAAVEETINAHTTKEIVESMVYDFGGEWGLCRVWLSSENQANYAAYLKAVEMGAELIKIKVETMDGESCYPELSPNDFASFYLAVVAHIKASIEAGWEAKDSIDYADLAKRINSSES